MKKFYEELIREIESSGELSPISRKKVWDKFESTYGEAAGKKKRQELELNALKKIQESWETYTPISKELMKQVLEQKIDHGGHPVLRWNMDNIFICTNLAENIEADKEKSIEKIDNVIETIMVLDRTIRFGNEVTESVYDTRGFLIKKPCIISD